MYTKHAKSRYTCSTCDVNVFIQSNCSGLAVTILDMSSLLCICVGNVPRRNIGKNGGPFAPQCIRRYVSVALDE